MNNLAGIVEFAREYTKTTGDDKTFVYPGEFESLVNAILHDRELLSAGEINIFLNKRVLGDRYEHSLIYCGQRFITITNLGFCVVNRRGLRF